MSNKALWKFAEQAGFEFPADYDLTEPISRLERFANLVAAAEREACARLVENFYTSNPNMLAEAIRSRK